MRMDLEGRGHPDRQASGKTPLGARGLLREIEREARRLSAARTEKTREPNAHEDTRTLLQLARGARHPRIIRHAVARLKVSPRAHAPLRLWAWGRRCIVVHNVESVLCINERRDEREPTVTTR